MQDTIARYDFLLKTYQSWLTDLTKLTVRHGICHQNIYPSHYLTLSTLYFPDIPLFNTLNQKAFSDGF
ncbi:Uncharacterised protein [Yersinia pseudotuberculosis]|nr:Uncharacterised protein [Yersinia pseudotuberculosis]